MMGGFLLKKMTLGKLPQGLKGERQGEICRANAVGLYKFQKNPGQARVFA